MGNSILSFRGNNLSGGDYTVESWLYFLACEIDELPEKPDWLLDAQVYWNIEARIQINIGTVDANLDKYVTDDERLQVMLQLAQATMSRLKTYDKEVGAANVKDLGNFDYTDYKLIDPVSHFHDANPVKLCQFGTLFCELLQGTLHWAKERVMRGYGAFKHTYFIDYLETLISDGIVGSGLIHLDEHGEEQINLYVGAYWVSSKNPTAHLTTYKLNDVLKYGYCIGMPDLIVDDYPFVPWHKQKVEYDVHELYGLPEHWYIDDEEHTVTVRRLVDSKLIVIETLHAGEQFVSNILGGKVIEVDTLLRTE